MVFQMFDWTKHVFVKHECPQQQQSQNLTKSLSPTFLTPPNPKGYVMSEKCDQNLNELTVKVYGQTSRQTDEWTNRRTEDLIPRCPWWTLQAPSIKSLKQYHWTSLNLESWWIRIWLSKIGIRERTMSYEMKFLMKFFGGVFIHTM